MLILGIAFPLYKIIFFYVSIQYPFSSFHIVRTYFRFAAPLKEIKTAILSYIPQTYLYHILLLCYISSLFT